VQVTAAGSVTTLNPKTIRTARCDPPCAPNCGSHGRTTLMDRHEKGLERTPGRLDRPLPEWGGGYGGDPRRLPKVVQKLVARKILTAEEKAELLWRFYELDQGARARQRRIYLPLLMAILIGLLVYFAFTQREWIYEQVMAWLSPPPSPPA
jgi:hypothetical protein